MKIAIKIFIGITILLLLFTLFAIFNVGVSIKYEVDVYEQNKISDEVKEFIVTRAKDLKSMLFFLWTFLVYQATTLILLIVVLTNLKDKN